MIATAPGPEHGHMPVAFWLLPGAPSLGAFAQRIEDLAGRYDAPRFLPHVTLHVDRVVRQADLAGVLDQVAARFAPFAMRAGPTGHSPVRFKALYVTLAGGDSVSLAAALADGVARWRPQPRERDESAAAYRLEPHLSLLYQELPEAERVVLAAEHCFAGESVYCDRITAVTPAPSAHDFARVEGWAIARPRLLVGGARGSRTS